MKIISLQSQKPVGKVPVAAVEAVGERQLCTVTGN
jgi:hypothetical protein